MSQYTITIPGNPALYQSAPLPENYELCGEIRREGEPVGGALAKIKNTGIYVQINAGVVRNLDPREVARALHATVDIPDEVKPAGGRPLAGQGIDWSQVDLSIPTSLLARELGVSTSSVSQQKKRHLTKPSEICSARQALDLHQAGLVDDSDPEPNQICSAQQAFGKNRGW